MAREKPKIDQRKFSDLLALLKQRLPHYTPEWPGTDDQDSGVALLKLFSHLTESVIKRLNQTPHQNLVAFLSMLGIKLLPAEPSRVPVRFKLVSGTSNEVLVPQRTQTTSAATDTRPELPFETEEDLLTTPSPLASVVSIDPEKDAIYQPPLGFLEREMPDTSAVAYALISFSRAGSSTLQLDHTDNLEKGDLLKLVSTTAMSSAAAETCVCPALSEESETTAAAVAEYVPIAEIKGTIVVLTTKLMRDYAPGTPVEKITKFHVFESRNLQEHILYLGHKDLFNVKSPVLFTLNITLMAGTEQGLEPLQVAWEYWGEIKGQEGIDWQAFTVQFDGSPGLSQNGEIKLLKTTEGEIKELEVNGIKNRWIRAKLQEPLPANATRRLPVLDNISFLVESTGAALPPDQAFHNDTPLDVNLPFYPFGLEPRLFDRFQLASKEVFSKKGAKVEIDVQLDSLALLAAPAAILLTNVTRKIFARGTGGRLVELTIIETVDTTDGGLRKSFNFVDHSYFSADTYLALPNLEIGTEATPSVVLCNGDTVCVFAKAENGDLVERVIPPDKQASWLDHNHPSGVKIKFDPFAVRYDSNLIKVFVVGEDGNLYVLNRYLKDTPISWQITAPLSFSARLDSSPYVIIHEQNPPLVRVFVRGNDEKLYEWHQNDSWVKHEYDNGPSKVDSRPFAQFIDNTDAKVFVRGREGNIGERSEGSLWELSVASKTWKNLAAPEDESEEVNQELTAQYQGVKVASNPHGYVEQPGSADEILHIFVRGTDNRLWEKTTPATAPPSNGNVSWKPHQSPIDVELRHSPFFLELSSGDSQRFSVFSSSNKNAVVEREFGFALTDLLTAGLARTGTNFSLTLDSNETIPFVQTETYYIKIQTGTIAQEFRKIKDYDDQAQLIHIEPGWDALVVDPDVEPDATKLPNSDSQYVVGKKDRSGQAQAGAMATITLAREASKVQDAYKDLNITITDQNGDPKAPNLPNKVVSYSGGEQKLAIMESPWIEVPTKNDYYKINLGHSGTPSELVQAFIKLASTASQHDEAYKDMRIVVWKDDNGTRVNEQSTLIMKYTGDTQEAVVAQSWNPEAVPDEDYEYEISTPETHPRGATFSIVDLLGGSTVADAYKDALITVYKLDEDGVIITKTSQTKRIAAYDGGRAILAEAWDQDKDVPDSSFSYRFERLEHTAATPKAGSTDTVFLDPRAAVKNNGAYDGMAITVKDRDSNEYTTIIKTYSFDRDTNEAKAIVDPEWSSGYIPQANDVYEITTIPHDVSDAAMSTIVLDSNASHANNPLDDLGIVVTTTTDFGLQIKQTTQITSYNIGTKVAKVRDPWNRSAIPKPSSTYVLTSKGSPRDANLASIKLNSFSASANDGAYDGTEIEVKKDALGYSQINKIVSYVGNERRAFVNDNWEPGLVPLGNRPQYTITAAVFSPQAATPSVIILDAGASSIPEAYKGMDVVVTNDDTSQQLRRIAAYTGGVQKLAIVEPAWELNKVPHQGTAFFLINYLKPDGTPFHQGKAQAAAKNTVTLAHAASNSDNDYAQKAILIKKGEGQPLVNLIDSYIGLDRLAILKSVWTEKPSTLSEYEIRNFEIVASWLQYEDTEAVPITPRLSWEYWNGRGWVVFQDEEHEFLDGTKDLLIDSVVSFKLPSDIEPTEVSGQENYWIRARIVGGDYGRETYKVEERVKGASLPDEDIIKETKIIQEKSNIRPPLIVQLSITYVLVEDRFPDRCLTYNNLDYIDQTDACITTDKRFSPFVPLEGQVAEEDDCGEVIKTAAGVRAQVIPPTQLGKAIYLGFMNPLRNGPLKIFFAAKELPYSDATKPKMEWSYRAENEWKRLSFNDASEGLIKQEILQFIAPRDFTAATRFGSFRYWMRGMLLQGEYAETPVLGGIYPNTTWAFQAETRRDEILGSSNGEAGQTFRFFRFPVRAGQIVRVREVLTEEEKEELIKLLGEQALHEVKDELGKVLETWVLWTEVENFFDSQSTDRHYTLDRATGELRFGDGRNGQIPPAGLNNLRAFSYQAGGGALGNVEAGAIQSLTTAIANVEAVINPVEAGGGSDTASLDDMLVIGPAMINHRQRAVTPQDFEWLAKQASRQVAKARCVRNLDSQSRRATGWVTLYLVPHSRESEPQPLLEMRRMVQRYVAEHCANTVAAPQHIFVAGPVYAEIDVLADLVVATIDAAARVEQEARAKLADFLHPLTGGPTDAGWEFGQGLSASDVYVLLEQIEGLDHVENLSFSRAGVAYTDLVEIGANELVAGGTLRINVTAKTGA